MTQIRDTTRHILDLFCDARPPRGVVIATTKWSETPTDTERRRAEDIQNYVRTSDIPQFTGEPDSAWDIIDRIVRDDSLDANQVPMLIKRLNGFTESTPSVSSIIAELSERFRSILPVSVPGTISESRRLTCVAKNWS
jgi:hypothetical protein